MLYEYREKIYIKVSNRYYEVNVEKNSNGKFDVIPNKEKKYIENVDKNTLISITLENAYKKNHKTEDSFKSKI